MVFVGSQSVRKGEDVFHIKQIALIFDYECLDISAPNTLS